MFGEEFAHNSESDIQGLKIGLVVSNEDPKAQERVMVRVIGVHNMDNTSLENGVWAHHCSPTRGASETAEPGDWVWVWFPNVKDPMFIVWLGFVRYSVRAGKTSDITPEVTQTGLE